MQNTERCIAKQLGMKPIWNSTRRFWLSKRVMPGTIQPSRLANSGPYGFV